MSRAHDDGARRKARGSRKRRAKPRKARSPARPIPAPPANEADRALPQPEDARHARGAERSVQDALGDWPETDADRWLLDREGEGVEVPGEGEGIEKPEE